MNPVDVKSRTFIDFRKQIADENPKFKMVILLEYQNRETFLQKSCVRN